MKLQAILPKRAIVDTFKEQNQDIPLRKTSLRHRLRMCANGIDKISYLTINSGNDKYGTFNSYATNRIVLPGN